MNYTAAHCSTLQHFATHYDTLQHTLQARKNLWFCLLHCLWRSAWIYTTLHHTAPHCNTPQHTATPCNTPLSGRINHHCGDAWMCACISACMCVRVYVCVCFCMCVGACSMSTLQARGNQWHCLFPCLPRAEWNHHCGRSCHLPRITWPVLLDLDVCTGQTHQYTYKYYVCVGIYVCIYMNIDPMINLARSWRRYW